MSATHPTDNPQNPVGLRGLAFVEFATRNPQPLRELFQQLGFSRVMAHSHKAIDLYRQANIVFLINCEIESFGGRFVAEHGPSIPSMGWLVDDAAQAARVAISRGARAAASDYGLPSVLGIGGSQIGFIDARTSFEDLGFVTTGATVGAGLGFSVIDHLTNNVPPGTMKEWADFYINIFGFVQIRYFDIKGKKTGLHSYALRSPCGTFAIPINEGTEEKSQINEYLREYRGAGIQHIALGTSDLLASLTQLRKTPVRMLDIDSSYYQEAFRRVPNLTEDRATVKKLGVLVDGDEEGYLLQIFSQNLIGPIFFEFIQRKNHQAFGEGNFGALFRSIERDQEKRGVL